MATVYALPEDIKLAYVAEGAANIVYRPILDKSQGNTSNEGVKTPPIPADLHSMPSADSSSTPPPTEIDIPSEAPNVQMLSPSSLPGHLLRLKKAVPWIPSYEALFETQATLINPHFPAEFLVPQILIKLPPNLTDGINANLVAAEELNKSSPKDNAGRAPKRHGLYLATDESHCLLVEDMTADPTKGEILVEVKAKWLAQSPNAPKTSKRCRTCALRAMRRAAAKAKDNKPSNEADKDFCPLDLGSADPVAVSRAVEAILTAKFGSKPAEDPSRIEKLRNSLLGFFLGTPILPRLRELQTQLDPDGILALPQGATPSTDFLVATTIRDCTLFLRARETDSGKHLMTIEGKLGDLDLKAPEPGKIDYWRGLEQDLIDGGWYEGRGAGEGTGTCLLERLD